MEQNKNYYELQMAPAVAMIMRILRRVGGPLLWLFASWGAFTSVSYGTAHLLLHRHAPDPSILRVIGTGLERIASLEVDGRSSLQESAVPESLIRTVKLPAMGQVRIRIAVDHGGAAPTVEYRFDAGVFRGQLCQLTIVIERSGAELLCSRYVDA